MVFKSLLGAAALAAGVSAQIVSWTAGSYALSINVPANTASRNSGSIYMQMSGPKGAQWFSFGQGRSMNNANMFIVYADGSGNVTVSPRIGSGHNMPTYNSAAKITVLEGSQVLSDGTLVANIRCDSCLSWTGGSMSATSSGSNWIMAYKEGRALDSTDVSARISQHDEHASNSIDLTKGTGGNSANPFVSAASNTESTTTAATTGASTTGAVTVTRTGSGSSSTGTGASTSAYAPLASSGSSTTTTSSSSSSASNNTSSIRAAHGVIMAVLFVLLFPSVSMTLYLPYAQKVRFVHAPLQILNTLLVIVGMAMGIILGQRVGTLTGYHQIIGFVVVGVLVLFQPALGIYQHLYYHRTGGRSAMGIIHRWLGRCMILLGIVNGGLGFMQSGPVGNRNVPTWSVIVYSIAAVVMFIIYIAVLFIAKRRDSRRAPDGEKVDRSHEGYEMHSASPVPQQQQQFEPMHNYQQARQHK